MKCEPLFRVGDIVTIVNNGETYSRYEHAAIIMRLKWAINWTPGEGEHATVVAVILHPRQDCNAYTNVIRILLGIRLADGKEVVIGQEGCVIYQKFEPKLFDEELFII